jgi:cytosolic carboxypeptidase protein 6
MRTIAPLLLAPAAFAAASCETVPLLSGSDLCETSGLAVDAGFPGGGQHKCVIAPDGSAVVSVEHEPALVEGINPSPWYAFRVRSSKARTASVTLDYTDYTHRYAPYVSPDGKNWVSLPASRIALNERKTRATLTLDLPAGTLWVAAQPLSSAGDGLNITRVALFNANFKEQRYGTSLEGKPLIGFTGGGSLHAIVAITRQHPPETTGEEAYRGFLERLIQRNDAAAVSFRARHKIILAPMPNPDGVDGGHWRLNSGGMDLNRDWGRFSQPETRALSEFIKAQVGARDVVAWMDFHSTDRTVIYAPPLDAKSPNIGFVPALKQKLDGLAKPPEWTFSHNPEGGTSKAWALDAMKAPGLTVEMWDQIPVSEARMLGAASADAMIEYFR